MWTFEGNATTIHHDDGQTPRTVGSEKAVEEERTTPAVAAQPVSLVSMEQLAATDWNQARWNKAEYLYLKMMRAASQALGEEHVDTLQVAASLAATLCGHS